MADASIKLAVEGGGDFKSAMKAAESSVKLFTTELKNLDKSLTTTSAVQSQVQQKWTALNGAAKAAKDKLALLSAEYKKQSDDLKKLADALDKAKQDYGEYSVEANKAEKALNNQTKVVNDLAIKMSNAQAEADKFEKELKDMEGTGQKLGSEFDVAGREVKEYGDEMNNAGQKTMSFKDLLGANIFGGLITKGIQLAVNELREFVKEIIEVGTEYEAQMAKVSAISGAYKDSTGQTLRELESLTTELSGYFSATEIGQAMEFEAMAGWSVDEIKTATQAILDLAQAGGVDLARASEILTTGLNGFGLGVEDAYRYADILATTAASAATSVDDMGDTFAKVAPLAQIAGYSVEDMAVAVGILGNNGLTGRKAGTALKGVVQGLVNPSTEAAEAMERLGISIKDDEGNFLSFDEALRNIREGVKDLDATEMSQFAQAVAGSGDAMTGFIELMKASDADFDSLTESINGSTGAAAEMAAVMGDTLEGDTRRADSAMQNLQRSIFNLVEGPLRSIKQGFADWANAMAKAIDEGSPLIGIIAGIAAGLAAMGIAAVVQNIIAMATAFGGLPAILTAVKTAFMSLNSAMGVIGLIAAAVSALIVLYNTNETFRNFVDSVWSFVLDKIKVVVEALVTFFTETIPNAIQTTIQFFTQDLPNAIETVITFFSELPAKIGQFLLDCIVKAAEWYIDMTNKARDTAKDFLFNVGEGLAGLAVTVWNKLVEAVTAAAQFIVEMNNTANEAAKQFTTALVDGLKSLPSKMLEIGKNIIQGLWNGIKAAFEPLMSNISNIVNKIKNAFTGVAGFNTHSPSKWSKAIGVYVMEGLVDGMEQGTNKVIPTVKNVADKVGQALQGSIDEVNAIIAEHTSAMEEAKAKKELEEYKQKLKDKYAELEKAEVSGRQKILDDIAKIENDWNEKQNEKAEKAMTQRWNDALKTLEKFKSDYERKLQEIEKKEESFANKLKDYGDLFTKDKNEEGVEIFQLADLNKDIEKIKEYGNALDTLQLRGVSESLLSEILGMDIDDATAYMGELLSMSDEKYNDYMTAWETKQKLSKDIANKFYQDEMQELSQNMLETLGEFTEDFELTGEYLMDGVADGVESGKSKVVKAIKEVLEAGLREAKTVMGIASPSKVMAQVGRFMAQGLDIGFVSEMKNTNNDIAAALLKSKDSVTNTGIMRATEAAVNGINAGQMLSTANGQPVYVNVILDGRQIAQAVFDPLKSVSKQRGQKI